MSAQVVTPLQALESLGITKAEDAAFAAAIALRVSLLKAQIAKLELHTADLKRLVSVFERLADCADIDDAEIDALAETIAGVPA